MNPSGADKFYQKLNSEINPQMRELTIALMNAQPDDPLQFMIDFLENQRKGIKTVIPKPNHAKQDPEPKPRLKTAPSPIKSELTPVPIEPDIIIEKENIKVEEPKAKSKSPPKRQIKKIESQKTDIQDFTEIDKQIEQKRARIVAQGKRGGFSSSSYGPNNPSENYKIVKIMKGNEQKVIWEENGR